MMIEVKHKLKNLRNTIKTDYYASQDIETLIQTYTHGIDELILQLWNHHCHALSDTVLIAVGGYGRAELQPYSDIDLLILKQDHWTDDASDCISKFIAACWDCGLKISHTVNEISHITTDAASDLTRISAWIESRLLWGNDALYQQFLHAISPDKVWSTRDFFQAKQLEQQTRYEKYDGTSYNLEPNIKHGPGGLRDIHMILWLGKRHFGSTAIETWVDQHFLTRDELALLKQGQRFLWTLSYGLHFIQDRREWRLLFDHQKTLAKQFHYEDGDGKLGLSNFMRNYYRMIKSLRQLNDVVLQLFREKILNDNKNNIIPINEKFQLNNQYLEIINDFDFTQDPHALFELFLLICQRPDIMGVRADTIRKIQAFRFQINESFRQDQKNTERFIQIMSEIRITPALSRMNRYDILAHYLPVFAEIVGQMQFDLYHVYTVDQHSIFIIRNIERFTQSEYREQFPLCADIMSRIEKPTVLYIAALFHDIAKGRGGDHSLLGESEALAFCQQHQLSIKECELITWLVKYHLLMSRTAQTKDIYDPDCIEQFTTEIQDLTHLDHLYLLTVADINATNPQLWNSWKATLLSELYYATKQQLSLMNQPIDRQALINEKQETVIQQLPELQNVNRIKTLWQYFNNDYFLREKTERILWHVQALLDAAESDTATIAIKNNEFTGLIEIFVYASATIPSFAIVTTVLANSHFSILEANVNLTQDQHTISTYLVLNDQHHQETIDSRLNTLQQKLLHHLTITKTPPHIHDIRITRLLKYFTVPLTISFEAEPERNRTKLNIIALDKPGLLARISHVFMTCGIQLLHAKIATHGIQAEDIFLITSQTGECLSDPELFEHIHSQLEKALTY